MDQTRRDDEFRQYVLHRRPDLLRTATLLGAGDRHLGEDLVQNTLTRLYLAWPRVRPETRDAYVHRALVNAAIDEGRRRKRRPEFPTETMPDRPAPELPDALTDGPLREALGALPDRMRAAVVLVYWLDLDTAAAAAALGCRVGTVKSQASRGIAKLRALLDAHPYAASGGLR
ncbi:MAG TPA: SigE family RNA polymerase sigma factor [Sporichthyaceae bacterium]|nr:SigE family RNA polymerase sigma factor [Sporichthyaceae bacterium]